jgi:hypothetical protein
VVEIKKQYNIHIESEVCEWKNILS